MLMKHGEMILRTWSIPPSLKTGLQHASKSLFSAKVNRRYRGNI